MSVFQIEFEKLATPNVWLVTETIGKITGKAERSELGPEWIRLVPFDDPDAMKKENDAWVGTNYPVNVLKSEIIAVFELIPKNNNVQKNVTNKV